jgi:hypothetical protein
MIHVLETSFLPDYYVRILRLETPWRRSDGRPLEDSIAATREMNSRPRAFISYQIINRHACRDAL